MAQVDEDEELAHVESSMPRPTSLDADRARDAAWEVLAAHPDAEIESGAAIAFSGPEVRPVTWIV